MKKLGFFGKLFYLINSVVVFLLIISFILPFVSPQKFPVVSLLSLAVSPLLFITFLFAVYWAIRFKRMFWLSAITLVISYFHFGPFVEIGSDGDSSAYANKISVLSYNVRLFNAYEQNGTKSAQQSFQELLKEKNPDILCLQEFYEDNEIDFSMYPYQFVHYKATTNKKGVTKTQKLGHAIFSKYPLVNSNPFDFKRTANNTLFTDVIVAKDTLRLYNLHLKSLSVKPSVSSLQESDKEKLVARMSASFKGQEQQMDIILKHAEGTHFPTIFVGDFNNTPFSYVYRKLSKNKKDGFMERGSGLGTTFSFDGYPMRIDYILVDPFFEVLTFETIQSSASDHQPIYAKLGWN